MPKLARLTIVAAAVALAACGHGDDHWHGEPVVAGLGLTLTRTDVETVRLDWSYDPVAAVYDVSRDGHPLASAASTSLIDASVVLGYRYCYRVVGRDGAGRVVSQSSTGCITVF